MICRRFLLPFWCLALGACGIFAPDRTTPPPVAPDAFANPGGEEALPDRWWTVFARDDLDRLMTIALAGNPDLAITWARLDQARARARIQGAALWPHVEADAQATWTESERETPFTAAANRSSSEEYRLGASASYEIDLWGRVRASQRSAVFAGRASAEDVRTAAISLSGSVALQWLAILAARAEAQILDDQLETAITYRDLIEARYRHGLATLLALRQQEQNVAAIQAQIPLVDERLHEAAYALAVLLGQPAGTSVAVDGTHLPELPPLPAIGLPGMVLQARPDVRAAWKRILAADWQLGAAEADRLPALRLSASASTSAEVVEHLFDNWVSSLIAGLIAPLLDGGRRAAEVARVRAVVAERVAQYRKVVLAAVGEVETALMRERQHRSHLTALDTQRAAARRALDQARSEYTGGVGDYLAVLTALTTVQRLEREALARRRELVMWRIHLYRALGGDWPQALEGPRPRENDDG